MFPFHFATRPCRSLAALLIVAGGIGARPAPADASIVVFKNGTKVESERLYYTYNTLVVITKDNDMQMYPNSEIVSIDGTPFSQAYWGPQPGHEDSLGEVGTSPDANVAAVGPGAQMAAIGLLGGLLPLKMGTYRRYNLENSRTTWVRKDLKMERREAVESSGTVAESVTGTNATGGITLVESISDHVGNKPPHEVRLVHTLETRADGIYLVAQAMEDANLLEPKQETTISQPPRLWPPTLTVGQSWIMAPFQRLGLYQAGRMEVVARETVTVPTGSYPEAYKIVGHGHVFGGSQSLKSGRLATDHGTIETTTWFVPGIGPVKEESKVHLHQDFFPAGRFGREVPLVVEERSVRTLVEFHPGG